MRLARLLSVLCVSLCAALPVRAETAGQVLSAVGDVLALRAGQILRMFPGASVESGDHIHTGPDGRVEIRFTDWGVISLRPRTDFVVEDYVYERRHGGREKAFFSLLNGGIRSLTGEIGHRDRAKYRLRTPISTIGIRGTDYSVLMCRQDCKQADGTLGPDGLYGSVFDGRIAVSPYGANALEREFGAGEYFHVANENSVPAPLFSPPSYFSSKLDPQAHPGGNTASGTPPITGTLPVDKALPGAGNTVSAVTGGLAGTLTSTLPVSPLLTVRPLLGSTVDTASGLLTISPLANEVVLPAAGLAGSVVNSALSMPALGPVGPLLNAVPAVVVPLPQSVLSTLTPLVPVPPVTLPPLPPATTPTLPPVTVPTLPPVTTPTLPPVTAPTLPPVTAPTLPPVTAPTLPPLTAPTLPPVTAPTLPPVTAPTLPTVPSLPLSTGAIAPLRR